MESLARRARLTKTIPGNFILTITSPDVVNEILEVHGAPVPVHSHPDTYRQPAKLHLWKTLRGTSLCVRTRPTSSFGYICLSVSCDFQFPAACHCPFDTARILFDERVQSSAWDAQNVKVVSNWRFKRAPSLSMSTQRLQSVNLTGYHWHL